MADEKTIKLEKLEQQKLTAYSRKIADWIKSIQLILGSITVEQKEVVSMLLRIAAESNYGPAMGADAVAAAQAEGNTITANEKAILDAIDVLTVIAAEQGELFGPDVRLDIRKPVNGLDALELFKIGAAILEIWDMIVEGTEGEPYSRQPMSDIALSCLAKVQLTTAR